MDPNDWDTPRPDMLVKVFVLLAVLMILKGAWGMWRAMQP